jgi:ankyrin repeat protein
MEDWFPPELDPDALLGPLLNGFTTNEIALEKGAAIDTKNNYGKTAVHLTSIEKRVAVTVVKLLLENGAAVEARDNMGDVAMWHVL